MSKSIETDIEVKRFYFPLRIASECPECGERCIIDFMDEYISYPRTGNPEAVSFVCWSDAHEHESEWTETLTLNLAASSSAEVLGDE